MRRGDVLEQRREIVQYQKIWNWAIFIVFSAFCGGGIGVITALFLQMLRLVMSVLWSETLQAAFSFLIGGIRINLYVILICILGGVLIGFWQHKYGDYPKSLEELLVVYKTNKNIPYNNLGIVAVAAFLPLAFGGSVGPEAGLAGILMMLFCWLRDKYKSAITEILKHNDCEKRTFLYDLLLVRPRTMLGFDLQYEDKVYTISKAQKIVIYLSASAGGVLCFWLMGELFKQSGMEFVRFNEITYTLYELIAFIPIVILGILVGMVFILVQEIVKRVFQPIEHKKILRAVVAGFLLGGFGMFLPYTMFSGEEQMVDLVNHLDSWSVSMLLATGLVKMLIINICIFGGWKGGNFFPSLFCSAALGFALASFLPVDSSFVVVIFMAAYCSSALGVAPVVAVLMMLFAPASALLAVFAASFIGGFVNKRVKTAVLQYKSYA